MTEDYKEDYKRVNLEFCVNFLRGARTDDAVDLYTTRRMIRAWKDNI